MEKKIYIIISGKYSDWNIVGFAETEGEAKEFCEVYNKKIQGIYSFNEYYYQEVESINGIKDISNGVFVYRFCKCFKNGKLEWRYDYPSWPSNFQYNYEGYDIGNKIKEYESFGEVIIEVVLRERNDEKAFKIANDMFAEWAYENADIFKAKYEKAKLEELEREKEIKFQSVKFDIERKNNELNELLKSGKITKEQAEKIIRMNSKLLSIQEKKMKIE